ncbi:hypothetical protein CDD81_2214 [Ophiocordyceps australis]|uniref:Origin recognition complex subunit 4 n=1 Tax=Ophiocordyceps australis TaxID=1399860 RepID=A0A2C5XY18_9HYPO|nr:hypothetical protein CDD81_2214 [Ophiocordyceps australis]
MSSGRKRRLLQPDADAQSPEASPSSNKRPRLDSHGAGQSPATPRALRAVASGALKLGLEQSQDTSLRPRASSSASRPAIKLAALKGTRWDPGDIKTSARLGNSTASSRRAVQKPPQARKPRQRRRAASTQQLDHDDLGSKDKTEDERQDSPDELAATEKAFARRGSHEELSGDKTPCKRTTKSLPASASKPTTPKGILTPSRRPGRPPKNVSFDRKVQGEVFFEDLPTTASGKKKKASKAKKKKKQDDEAHHDEIRCAICSKADSHPPNQIILCDNCDYAVHQVCYEIVQIPQGDWLCKACAQQDVWETAEPSCAPEASSAPEASPDIANLARHLQSLKRVLVDRCSGRRRLRICGQTEPLEKARQLVQETILAGQGNSMLLIGPRGSGKTTMIESIIGDLRGQHGDCFHVVKLNGFIHTDDKLALKEIWRQLGREMELEEELISRATYADTMASLLALLSHPSEIMETDKGVTSQSIVFMIDEMDLFASHARQTLLYNLFDIAQSRKAPIAVLGCTTRLDVVERLEKRVKSRFSHRCIYLSLPRSLPAYWKVCRQGLVVEGSEAASEGIDVTLKGYDDFERHWTRAIEQLYKQQAFQKLLQYHFLATKSAAAFLSEWILPLSQLTPDDLELQCPAVGQEAPTSLAAPESRLHVASALSELDVSLLIAAARLDIVAHTDTVNFAMAYDEYSSLVGRQRAAAGALGTRVWGRAVAAVAWERLVGLGLLVPAGGQGGLDERMWRVELALDELAGVAKLSPVQARWCREI